MLRLMYFNKVRHFGICKMLDYMCHVGWVFSVVTVFDALKWA